MRSSRRTVESRCGGDRHGSCAGGEGEHWSASASHRRNRHSGLGHRGDRPRRDFRLRRRISVAAIAGAPVDCVGQCSGCTERPRASSTCPERRGHADDGTGSVHRSLDRRRHSRGNPRRRDRRHGSRSDAGLRCAGRCPAGDRTAHRCAIGDGCRCRRYPLRHTAADRAIDHDDCHGDIRHGASDHAESDPAHIGRVSINRTVGRAVEPAAAGAADLAMVSRRDLPRPECSWRKFGRGRIGRRRRRWRLCRPGFCLGFAPGVRNKRACG